MAVVNTSSKEINAKIVYYGPGRSGKTTNIQYIHAKLKPEHKGELMTLSTEQDRTLFFDFLPVDLGDVRGMQTRFHLYTVPGQVFYNSTRKLVLKNADGVVFVADSERRYLNENIESFNNLLENLKAHGRNAAELPVVLQYNKRDAADAMPVTELNSILNRNNFPVVEAVAARGEGVLQTLTTISKLVIRKLSETPRTEAAPAPPPLSPLPPATAAPGSVEADLDDEESAVLDNIGPSATRGAPATPAPKAMPAVATPTGLELVQIQNPQVEGQGELVFTLELRDPATGRSFLAPVRLSMDFLIRAK